MLSHKNKGGVTPKNVNYFIIKGERNSELQRQILYIQWFINSESESESENIIAVGNIKVIYTLQEFYDCCLPVNK